MVTLHYREIENITVHSLWIKLQIIAEIHPLISNNIDNGKSFYINSKKQPIAASDQANNIESAVSGATHKLKAALDTIVGRRKNH